MSHQRTVYVIDRDAETRRSLTLSLASIGAETWPFASPAEFLEIADHLAPGCLLLDMDSPDALALLTAIQKRETGWPIIATSGRSDVRLAVESMKLGLLDFLEKPLAAACLAAVLMPAWSILEASVEHGEARRAASERLGRLTPRELDISIALFGGQSNKAVAYSLGISVRTVEMHRAHIMAKLGVRSIAEAAVMAARAGILPGPHGNPAPVRRPTGGPAFLALVGTGTSRQKDRVAARSAV